MNGPVLVDAPSAAGSSSAPGFPVRTKIYARNIGGVHTDFSFSAYQDKLLIVATQLGALGTVISATQDATFDGSTTFNTSVLMGKRDEPMLQLAARRIVEAAHSSGCSLPMLICLGLKAMSPGVLRDVVAAVEQDNIWS